MSEFEVFLECGAEGGCMAHVLALPGCFVAAAGRQQALDILPGAIKAYNAYLLRHGQPALVPEQIELIVMEEHARSGPFHPVDRAALFEPEKRPLGREEVERYLALAAFNRCDLLGLIRGLSDSILDWRPSAEAMSIRRILNHIGRADLWYISRVTEPLDPVPDWRKLPSRQFLAESRSAVAQAFRQLGDAELTRVNHPSRSDGDSSEAWTARKALRRLLEHEREHTEHIRENLAAWSHYLLTQMAASRSSFIWQLVSLDEDVLTSAPLITTEVGSPWTAKDLLGHVAAWDELYAGRTQLVDQGKTADIESVDLETRNAAVSESRKDWSLDEAVQALGAAREESMVAIFAVADADLHRRFQLPWGRRTTLATWARWRYQHDDSHTRDLLAWRASAKPAPAVGPKSILRAALESGRQEMLATATLIPAGDRETRPICGEWALKDVLGHVADWEWYGVEKLNGPSSRRSLDIRFRGIQRRNDAHAAARRNQPWEDVWFDFQSARLAMGQLLEKMSQEDLAQPFAVPWSKKWTAYRWFYLWLHHEREHAADLRANLDLPNWPRRLKQFS